MHTAMEHAMVSVATGVLSPLLVKLSSLVEKEYGHLKGVRRETIAMRDELSSMHALLGKLASEDDPDVQVKEWRNQIRDLSYDVEDCLDDFVRRVELGHGPPDGYFRKTFSKIWTLGARHDIAQKIRELKDRVDDVSKRHGRYAVMESASAAGGPAVPIDAQLLAHYAKPGNLVGIDGPRQEIVRLLDEQGEKRLRVVSIAGFGGLGKTTLAYEVLRELGEQFDFHATVAVSQSPDIIKILSKILSQAKVKPPHVCDIRDEQELIEEIRSYLHTKRYFILIDDIWDPLVWEFIRAAFPDNDLGSRVITTTRVQSVAATCCMYLHDYVYMMKPLNDEDSRRLFFQRIFGTEDHCPGELKEVSSQILRKCGGLPLAIIVISSLLASQATKVKEYWGYVQSSIDYNVDTDGSLEVMRQILNLSYKNLSPRLKTCFVYLGAYPEDCVIWRDDLVRQWVAEGFAEAVDVAGSCFNELVNRSMIQPSGIGYSGEPVSCKVHDMMLDLVIRKRSAEENFMTVIDHSKEKIKGSSHNVRRLFHHCSNDSAATATARRREMRMPPMSIDLSKVRSFSICGSSTYMPPLSKFKFIRVLSLDLPRTEETIDLTAICKLFQLRYLKVRSESMLLLPAQIRALQHLETLEIGVRRSRAGIVLPSDVAQLPCLSYLSILPHMTSLPDGIAAIRCLRSLASFYLDEDSLDKVRGLRHLTNLKELYLHLPIDVCFEEAAEGRVDVLCSSLPDHGGGCCRLYVNAWSPHAWFENVPRWIGRMEALYSLELAVGELSAEGVAVLAGLPALVRLDLWVRSDPGEDTIIAGAGFPALKHLIFTCVALRLSFQAGAMPSLQRLKLEFNAAPPADGTGTVAEQGGRCAGNALTGVEHLLGLKEISASIGCLGPVTATRAAAVSALKDAIRLHPSCPRVSITSTQGAYGLV